MTITEPATQTAAATDEAIEAFVEKLFGAVLSAQEVQAVYLGDRLGWYQALVEGGALTSTALAERTGTVERYAREWLEFQVVSGYLAVDDAAAGPLERRYSVPAAHVEALTEPESLNHAAPFARFVVGLGKNVDAIAEVYRHGGGVGWHEMGSDAIEAQAAANRPMFVNVLAQQYLASVPDVDAALRAGGRVADVGCGGGWSSIGVARAYPNAVVHGFDVDEASIELARRNVEEAGLSERVEMHHVDAGSLADATGYDVVMALECIHDLPDPVSVLSTMRGMAAPDGIVIVMDERVGETFTGQDDPVERLMYGFSIMCCLPDGMSHDHTEATGTVMRPDTLRGYAQRAGFADIEILPIDDDFFRFYRLV